MSTIAVIRDRGMQFSVRLGDTLQVNRLDGKVGSEISIHEVLTLITEKDIKVGQPLVKGAKVNCEILEHSRGKKVLTFKIKRRKNYRRKIGHRQDLTVLRVKEILAGA